MRAGSGEAVSNGAASDERAALPAADGVLLWSMRAWVLARCRTEDLRIEERIEAALGGLDAAEAGCGLCGFMDAVERGGTRTVTVERMCARRLTADERTLLGVFARVQAGRTAEAARALRDMVAPASLGAALERAADVALALTGAGHALGTGPTTPPQHAGARLH